MSRSLNNAKLCECGCGQPTAIAKETWRKAGRIAGQPMRFIRGHHSRHPDFAHIRPGWGANNPCWKGGRTHDNGGYVLAYDPSPERSSKYRAEHILIAERALGRPMPKGAHVHHVNGDKKDNRPQNLVVCENNAYHKLLHLRQAALDACGHADWRKCRFCKRWDDTANMSVIRGGKVAYHRPCFAAYARNRKTIKQGIAA